MQNLYSGIIINISLLVLIATILTNTSIVQKIILQEQQSLKVTDQLVLAVIFGAFCIFSTCTGIKVNGAIQNTRVLGVLAAGLLGGPITGMGAALIGAVHRFLYDPAGFSSLACTVSTLFEGLLGSIIYCVCRKNNWKQNPVSLFAITAFAECCQMIIILAIARPIESAWALVNVIAVPMILCNSLGMILFFSVFAEVFRKQDLIAADKIRCALNIADECIPYIQKLTKTKDDYNRMAEIIRGYRKGTQVIFLKPDKVTRLNDCMEEIPDTIFSEQEATCCEIKHKNIYCAPLTQDEMVWAYLVLVTKNVLFAANAEQDFVAGLARFFSRNYELAQIEQQKKLRQRAEYQALQLQINPHFLFNSLNTIAYFCRERPERARELILTLSVYFRNTLVSTEEYMIPLEKELEHVKAYTELEKGRFEDRLEIEWDLEAYDIKVPTLILQPIVANAIKHGAMKREKGFVRISGSMDRDCLEIVVEDNGPGMSEEALKDFSEHRKTGHYGMRNVDARMRSIYGEEHGITVKSDNDGTKIKMRFWKNN